MRILFDIGTPRGLAWFLKGHVVQQARLLGWEELENGSLIAAAEEAGIDVFLTTDKNVRYQQNLTHRRIAVIVLRHSQWPMVRLMVAEIAAAVDRAQAGSYSEVEVPIKD
jgi:hypothetical protein